MGSAEVQPCGARRCQQFDRLGLIQIAAELFENGKNRALLCDFRNF